MCDWAKQWTQIPDTWKNAWLVLVPNIARPVSPKNLRPIGLTESSGRAYARMLQTQLLISLHGRLTATDKDKAAMEHAKTLGCVDGHQNWKVLKCNTSRWIRI